MQFYYALRFSSIFPIQFFLLLFFVCLSLPDSLHCERCPSEFWSDVKQIACVPRQLDYLSFNETLGITLTTVAVSGAALTTAVFVVFVYYRQTPMVRNQSNVMETTLYRLNKSL